MTCSIQGRPKLSISISIAWPVGTDTAGKVRFITITSRMRSLRCVREYSGASRPVIKTHKQSVRGPVGEVSRERVVGLTFLEIFGVVHFVPFSRKVVKVHSEFITFIKCVDCMLLGATSRHSPYLQLVGLLSPPLMRLMCRRFAWNILYSNNLSYMACTLQMRGSHQIDSPGYHCPLWSMASKRTPMQKSAKLSG
jgi:hypothetical protein